LVIALVSATSQPTTKNGSDEAIWGIAHEGCRTRILADRDHYSFGEPVHIHAMIQNVGRPNLDVAVGHFTRYEIQVSLPDGSPAPLTLWGRNKNPLNADGSSTTIKLAPGQTKTDEYPSLNRIFDMTIGGRYSVTARTSVVSDLDSEASVVLFSNTIFIWVENDATK